MVNKRLQTEKLPDADRCKEIRVAAGLSQAKLAAAIGVSPSAIHKWERDTKPRGLQRAAYAKALRELEKGFQ